MTQTHPKNLDKTLENWDFVNTNQIPLSLRDLIISKGVNLDAMPADLQIKIAHIVYELWIKFENEVITNLESKELIPEKWAIHWRIYLKSNFNQKFLEKYPELKLIIHNLTLKFIGE